MAIAVLGCGILASAGAAEAKQFDFTYVFSGTIGSGYDYYDLFGGGTLTGKPFSITERDFNVTPDTTTIDGSYVSEQFSLEISIGGRARSTMDYFGDRLYYELGGGNFHDYVFCPNCYFAGVGDLRVYGEFDIRPYVPFAKPFMHGIYDSSNASITGTLNIDDAGFFPDKLITLDIQSVQTVPLPGSLSLIGSALVALGLLARARQPKRGA